MRLPDHRNKISIYLLLTTLIMSMLFPFFTVWASSPTVVRVGYYENEVFEEGASPGAVKTGYAYEYYRKISEYTGWEYEYVYGSFGDLYDMLLSGEIDLLAGLAKREDRTSIIGYPALPMGNETYALVKHDDDLSVNWSVSSVAGKRIGVLKSAVADVLMEYLQAQSIVADVITFDDYDTLYAAFDENNIDILAVEGDGAYGREHGEVVCSFGSSDYYLCVNIKRRDLLEELDAAQSHLAAEESGYLNTLNNKYYSASVSGHTYSIAEREWMAGNPFLRVGYLNNYLPYSSTLPSGEVTGIIKDLIPAMCEELSLSHLQVTYTGYDRYDDMIEAIRDEQIDVAFPVGGGLYYSEENGIYQSTPVVSTITELVFKGEYDEGDVMHFAVNENNRMQYYYISTCFPEAEITMYPDIEGCLEAVLEGKESATTLNGLRANEILKNSRYDGLYLKQLTQTDDRCFGVKIGNEGLLKLLNRGVNLLGPDYAQDMAFKYTDKLYSYTISDMIKDNIWLFLTMLLFIAVMAIVMIKRDLKRTRLANRLKSDFVSNMSHEIRTPITAILGMNEMIQYESDDEKILQYSDNIEKAGESLLGIINDILDFSKIEAGRMEIINAPYSLPELLGGLDLMIRFRAQEKKLDFSMDVDEQLPVMPVGDLQKIRQVITNLLSNAVKYTEKGNVKLSLKLISSSEKEFTMEVAVEDTGIGIRDEERDKLYSAFDRLDLEKTRNIEGSGLGLTITRRMLMLMGSDIRLESEYGKGSRFYFLLKQGIEDPSPIGPFRAATAQDGRRQKNKNPGFTAPDARILIVDDTPMNLQVICGLLKRNEMKLDTAESGSRCLELFEKNDYDVVLLDQRMPNMDGVETLKNLRERFSEKLERTPVISLTANAFSAAREQMLRAGFTDYLTKPVNLSDLERMLLKYLPEEKVRLIKNKEPETEEAMADPLYEVEGLDTKKGLEYCGDEEDYLDALKVYLSSVNERADKLEDMMSRRDTIDLTLLFHSLKSTSLTIGAQSLASLAADIEEMAGTEGSEDRLEEMVIGFVKRYRALGAQLEKALKNR